MTITFLDTIDFISCRCYAVDEFFFFDGVAESLTHIPLHCVSQSVYHNEHCHEFSNFFSSENFFHLSPRNWRCHSHFEKGPVHMSLSEPLLNGKLPFGAIWTRSETIYRLPVLLNGADWSDPETLVSCPCDQGKSPFRRATLRKHVKKQGHIGT